MNLIFLIIGLSLCILSAILSVAFKLKKGSLPALFSKVVATLSCVLLAVLLSFSKNQVGYYASMPICLIIIGLVCSVVADFAFEAKSMYEFHQKQYLNFGAILYLVSALFNVGAILTFVNTQANLQNFVVPILIIVAVCALLTVAYYLISTKLIKLNYKEHTIVFMLYFFILLVATFLSCYFTIIFKNYYMLILAFAFVLFTIFFIMLSTKHFEEKQKDKTFEVLTNSVYLVAQILLALFIYFV